VRLVGHPAILSSLHEKSLREVPSGRLSRTEWPLGREKSHC
jgi:hypothetical protein